MKRVKSTFLLFCVSFITIKFSFGQTKTLEITLIGIEDIQGQIVVLVYDDEKNFLKDERKYPRRLKFPVTHDGMAVSIADVPMKDCGIMLYHDKNDDDKCNRNMVGMPTEKIGFSNNARPKMRAPKFEEAKVEAKETSIVIELFKI